MNQRRLFEEYGEIWCWKCENAYMLPDADFKRVVCQGCHETATHTEVEEFLYDQEMNDMIDGYDDDCYDGEENE